MSFFLLNGLIFEPAEKEVLTALIKNAQKFNREYGYCTQALKLTDVNISTFFGTVARFMDMGVTELRHDPVPHLFQLKPEFQIPIETLKFQTISIRECQVMVRDKLKATILQESNGLTNEDKQELIQCIQATM